MTLLDPAAVPGTTHATHDVTNQPPPLFGHDVAADPALLAGLEREGAGWHAEDLHRLGRLAGSAEAQQWGEDANRHEPELRTHDRYGHRIDEVDFHPAWHKLLDVAVSEGLAGAPWADEVKPGVHVARAASFYTWSQAEGGHGCPVSMTYAVVPALRAAPDLAAAYDQARVDPAFVRAYDEDLAPIWVTFPIRGQVLAAGIMGFTALAFYVGRSLPLKLDRGTSPWLYAAGAVPGEFVPGARAAFLTSAVTASDSQIPVDDATGFEQGVAEVGNETIFIKSVDYSNNLLTVSGDGRGYYSTTAAVHGNGARITMAPTWSRQRIMSSVNEAIVGTFPTLFAIMLINFVIIAFVVWRISKAFIKPAAAPAATKNCPFCKMAIDASATRCSHCTSQL